MDECIDHMSDEVYDLEGWMDFLPCDFLSLNSIGSHRTTQLTLSDTTTCYNYIRPN